VVGEEPGRIVFYYVPALVEITDILTMWYGYVDPISASIVFVLFA
jgi:hypothetical protein